MLKNRLIYYWLMLLLAIGVIAMSIYTGEYKVAFAYMALALLDANAIIDLKSKGADRR